MRFRLLAACLVTLSGLGCAGGIATLEEDAGGRDVPPNVRDDPGPGREEPPSTRDVPPESPSLALVLGTSSQNQGGGEGGTATPGIHDGGGSQ